MLLDYLNENNITSTFFVVGSRVLSRPQILQAEYMAGHQISVHTWSHPYLTKLSNEQIVAEFGWSKQVIKDVIGVTPNTFRPPYGDIDDRVRAIAAQMGLTPIIWTSTVVNNTRTNFDTVSFVLPRSLSWRAVPHCAPRQAWPPWKKWRGGRSGGGLGAQFDARARRWRLTRMFEQTDWNIPGGTATGESSLTRFEEILNDYAPTLDTGFIVLEHDLYQQTVDLAVGYVLPMAIASGKFTLKSIISCLGLSSE